MTANRIASVAACTLIGLLSFVFPTAGARNPGVHPSMTVLGITLGHTDLASVQETLGRAKIWGDGDASSAETKVCYVTRGADPVVLVFASNAEMAGPPENEVTDVRIVRSAAYRDRSKCGNLAVSANEVRADNGLKLGLDQEIVRKILGPSTRTAGSEWDYSWNVDRQLATSDKNYQYWVARKEECFDGKSPFFTISSGITVKFYGDAVIGLSFRRIESMC